GLAVSVEGKGALYLRALSASSTVWILPLLRVWQYPFEGKGALFLRAGVHPLQFGYCLMRV
uniref:hypothetical protein n=1 Tax=Bartonella sp. CM120XJJH TaxID=3243544 RepID=UPI0035CF6A12